MSEWVAPFEELDIYNELGSGRFGKVYRGKWHGEVAIKMIEIDNPTEEQLNAFKFQVSQQKNVKIKSASKMKSTRNKIAQ